MDRIDLFIAAFRSQYCQSYNWKDYIKAGFPFGTGRGAKIWREFQMGATVN